MTLARVLLNPVSGSLTAFAVDVDKIVGLVEYHDGRVFATIRRHENGVSTKLQVSNGFDTVFMQMNRGVKSRVAVKLVDAGVRRMVIGVDKIVGLEQYTDGSIVISYQVHEFGSIVSLEVDGDFHALFNQIA